MFVGKTLKGETGAHFYLRFYDSEIKVNRRRTFSEHTSSEEAAPQEGVQKDNNYDEVVIATD